MFSHRIDRIACIAVVVIGTSIAAGAPTARASMDRSQIPDQATWYFQFDAAAFRDSVLGKWIIEYVKDNDEAAKGLREIEVLFGVNPLTDLQSVSGWGKSNEPDQGVILVEFTGNVEQLQRIAQIADEYKADKYRGLIVHSFVDKENHGKKRNHVAIRPANAGKPVMLVGSHDRDLVEQAVDRLMGEGRSIEASDNGALNGKPTAGSYFYMAGAGMAPKEPGVEIWSTVRRMKIDVGEVDRTEGGPAETRFEMAMEAKSAEKAEMLETMVRGIKAMVQLSADGGGEAAVVAKLLQYLEIDRDGGRVSIRYRQDSAELIEMAEAAVQRKLEAAEEDGERGGIRWKASVFELDVVSPGAPSPKR